MSKDNLSNLKNEGVENVTASIASLNTQDTFVNEFREELKKAGVFCEERHDEHVLKRFGKARKFKMADAVFMMTESEKWRKEFGVENVLKEFAFKELAEVQKIYPRFHHKTDKLGRPIYIEKLSKLDLKKIMAVTTSERMLKHHVREYEKFLNYKMAACGKKINGHIGQGFTVLDLAGVPMSQFPSVKSIVNDMSKISQDNYPETMGILFIINAPFLFTSIWYVIKGWLDEQTVKKIHLLGSSYKDKLLELVDPENLPEAYGGKCKCEGKGGCELSDIGPWNDGTVEGYPKLEWEYGATRDNATFVPDAVKALLSKN
ncbi:cytosolic factor, phosphatidylinositol/phosphatidylcholine transfer protein [Clydaea vesicula]|uniref:Cytosolic factor, phosphatidylinositol/phosphatidylcholine transfer protein n=1 Tax=Clydaea vesicula TaxID=447962 RepID=A0AAD5XSZ8_9FUNG|nr:cytosolic factor, phosphatidylinositol/phosphatidylcholine transfer protein [Clydaea vesicula]